MKINFKIDEKPFEQVEIGECYSLPCGGGNVIIKITGVGDQLGYWRATVIQATPDAGYHPGYSSSRWSLRFAVRRVIPEEIKIPENHRILSPTDIICKGDMYFHREKNEFIPCRFSAGKTVQECFKPHIIVVTAQPTRETKEVDLSKILF